MSDSRTTVTDVDPAAFLAALGPAERRSEALRLDAIFRAATGFGPRMWGPSIIGYGRYAYRYDSGRSGEMCATGFSPRRAEHAIYILPGYDDMGDLLARLGRHRAGKACLYIRRLADIDEDVLALLIRRGLDRLGERWPVTPA
ncbi:MAG: DUF1801 domain-containing protein [Rhodobacteraceae bacterium]|nr:DUF1801 domain-containing protein [Paracoccaceae bacterium]